MKKILSVPLLALFALVGCGGEDSGKEDVIVCTHEVEGEEVLTMMIAHENSEFLSITMETTMDISHYSEDDLEAMTGLYEATGIIYRLDRDRLAATIVIDNEELVSLVGDHDLKSFVEQMEADGATCN